MGCADPRRTSCGDPTPADPDDGGPDKSCPSARPGARLADPAPWHRGHDRPGLVAACLAGSGRSRRHCGLASRGSCSGVACTPCRTGGWWFRGGGRSGSIGGAGSPRCTRAACRWTPTAVSTSRGCAEVVAGEYADLVTVDMLSGQAPAQFEASTSQLAHTFAALRCRVVVDRPGRIVLEFTHGDPLTETVTAFDPDPDPDLERLPIGRRQDGTPWTHRLIGTHLLVAGATGAGKGSVVWSLIRAMGWAIREGSVEVWAIDPKGGMELNPGAGLFTPVRVRRRRLDGRAPRGCSRPHEGSRRAAEVVRPAVAHTQSRRSAHCGRGRRDGGAHGVLRRS